MSGLLLINWKSNHIVDLPVQLLMVEANVAILAFGSALKKLSKC